MAEEKTRPLIPFKKAINLARVDRMIDRALERLRAHYDTCPVGLEFNTFARDFFEIFPQNLRYDIFFVSIMTMAGQLITRETIKLTAWRLAANIDRLRAGIPVPPWTKQQLLEWASVKIGRAQIGRSRSGRIGFWYDYRVQSGSPAGLRFKLFWSTKYARFIARSLGFSRSKGKYRFHDGTELVGMQLYFLFDPELSVEERPTHYHFYVPASCKAANQKILKRRIRTLPCPMGYSLADMQCYRCPIGNDKCPAACHPFSYQIKACPRCMQTETWFDPAGRGVICLTCEEKEVLTQQG